MPPRAQKKRQQRLQAKQQKQPHDATSTAASQQSPAQAQAQTQTPQQAPSHVGTKTKATAATVAAPTPQTAAQSQPQQQLQQQQQQQQPPPAPPQQRQQQQRQAQQEQQEQQPQPQQQKRAIQLRNKQQIVTMRLRDGLNAVRELGIDDLIVAVLSVVPRGGVVPLSTAQSLLMQAMLDNHDVTPLLRRFGPRMARIYLGSRRYEDSTWTTRRRALCLRDIFGVTRCVISVVVVRRAQCGAASAMRPTRP